MKKFADYENLLSRLKRLIDAHADGKYTVFAKKLGIPVGTFYNIMKGQVPNAEHLFHISEIFGISLDWLITGDGEVYKKDILAVCPDELYEGAQETNIIDIEHSDIIKQFHNKSLARDINKDLVDLERMNGEALKKVGIYIKGVVEGIRLSSEKGQGSNEKAEGDFAGGERRSGLDRRKAAGGDR